MPAQNLNRVQHLNTEFHKWYMASACYWRWGKQFLATKIRKLAKNLVYFGLYGLGLGISPPKFSEPKTLTTTSWFCNFFCSWWRSIVVGPPVLPACLPYPALDWQLAV